MQLVDGAKLWIYAMPQVYVIDKKIGKCNRQVL